MPTTRISEPARRILQELARETGKHMQEVLELAIECYRRQRFIEETNTAYAALKSNKKAWREEQVERRAWDITLSDGIRED